MNTSKVLALAILAMGSVAQAAIVLDFESLGYTELLNINSGATLPGSAAGVWSNPIQGFQFMLPNEGVGVGFMNGTTAIGKKGWETTPLAMKAADDSAFTIEGFNAAKPNSWAGVIFDYTLKGYDAPTGGNVLFTETFTSAAIPTTFSVVSSTTSVYRVEWSGHSSTGPGAIDNIQITPVPEPSTYAAIVGLFILAVSFIRRRK
ncbi:MAG: PEP-CTERM sorting domain-containing protein [Verrucomicrobiota bacterium]|nr:PEP-CTERM sorting domain-containing protein [Verrucomicrobiota bacterium]